MTLSLKKFSLLSKREYGFSRVGVGKSIAMWLLGTPSATLLLKRISLLCKREYPQGVGVGIYSVQLRELPPRRCRSKESPSCARGSTRRGVGVGIYSMLFNSLRNVVARPSLSKRDSCVAGGRSWNLCSFSILWNTIEL